MYEFKRSNARYCAAFLLLAMLGGSAVAAEPVNFTGHALRLTDVGYVELKDGEKLIDPTKPFTIEMWVRTHPEVSRTKMFEYGTPPPPKGQYFPWNLGWLQYPGKSIAYCQVGPGHTEADGSYLATYVWNHLAACSDGKQVTMYFNGRKGKGATIGALPQEIPAGRSILGDTMDLDQNGKLLDHPAGIWERDYRVVRFSSIARYTQDFEPALTLESDRHTLALLDFSKPQEGQVKDLSGKGHHGVVHDGKWIELPSEAPVASDGSQIVRLKPGEYVDVHSPKDNRLAALNLNIAIEMWCRWKVGAKGMQWLGTSQAGEQFPGAFSIKAIPDKTETRLQLTYLDASLKEVTDSFVLPAPDGKWHRFSITGNPGFSSSVLLDGQVIGKVEHRMHSMPRERTPTVLVIGDPSASGDEESQLEIRSFRISKSNDIAWGFIPTKLYCRRDTTVLWDFSKGAGNEIPDLSGNQTLSRLSKKEVWLPREKDESDAVVGYSYFSNGGVRRLAPLPSANNPPRHANNPPPRPAPPTTVNNPPPTPAPQPPARPSATVSVPIKLTSTLTFHTREAGGKPLATAQVWLSKPISEQVVQEVFTHELCRQGLLLAAREDLSLLTRDQVLGECDEYDASTNPSALQLTTITTEDEVRATLTRLNAVAGAPPLWEGKIAYQEQSEPALLAQIETWARTDWPKSLRAAGYEGETRPRGKAPVPAKIEAQLARMDFLNQFAALRALHVRIQADGPSAQLEGALARGYANLGMLTEFHWNHAHKALKARALLYAERAATALEKRPGTLANRAYAWALCGFHQHALADLKAANHPPSLPWTEVLEAYCRFDVVALSAFDDKPEAELAAVLRFFTFEHPTAMRYTLAYGGEVLQKNPFCFRVLDGMFSVRTLGNLRRIAELSPALLQAALRTQLPLCEDLPELIEHELQVEEDELLDEVELIRQLRVVGAPESDSQEFTWRSLAQMIEETHFVHAWHQGMVMRFNLGVPMNDFIAAVEPRIANHPHREYVRLLEGNINEFWKKISSLEDLTTNDLPVHVQAKLFAQVQHLDRRFWSGLFNGQRLRQDLSYYDLVAEGKISNTDEALAVAKRLEQVSPHSPAGPALHLFYASSMPAAEWTRYEEQLGWHPEILFILSNKHFIDDKKREVLTQRWAEVSQEYRAYRVLANIHREKGEMDKWKATLESFLKTPQTGLEHAQARVEIAEYFMKDQKWKEAEPYAVEAAESYAAWAMMSAIKCYEGQGDLRKAEVWVRRLADRYQPEAYEAWLKKHGLKPGDEIPERQEPAKKAE